MSKRTTRLLVESPEEDLLRSYRSKLDRLWWEHLEEGESYILSREDPVRLCCKESPAQARLELEPVEGGTIAEILVSVPGFGPIASRNLRDRLGLIERAVRSSETRGTR